MKYLFSCVFFFCGFLLFSQNKEVLYGLDETPQSLMLNPGTRIVNKFHFGIPLMSHFHFNGGSSGVSAYDIFQTSSIDINTRIRNKIFELDDRDFFTATQQLEVLNFGWKNRKEFYFSGGIYQEFDMVLYFPKDLAVLAWEGNANDIGKAFDLGEINTRGDLLMVYHFGVAKRWNEKITLGARAKIYSSMLSFSSAKNSGTVETRFSESGNNIYEHIATNINLSLYTSGIAPLIDLEDSSQITNKISNRAFFGGNLGLGIDFGATYEISDKWTASASLIDLGAIFHTKDVQSYSTKGDYTFEGIELLFPPLGSDESAPPYYGDLIDEIEDTFPIDTTYNTYSQMRPLKTYASLKYNFGKTVGANDVCNCLDTGEDQRYNQSIGVQMFNVFRPKGPQFATTLFYYRRVTNYLTLKTTYTVDSYSYTNFGLGLVTNIKMVNFYVVANNLQWYGNIAKAKSVSLQLGLNIIIDEN